MESSKMADGRLAILDILENKELFFKYVLGEDVKYYTNYNQKIVDEDIDDLKRPMTESERKLAELKAKVKAKNSQRKGTEEGLGGSGKHSQGGRIQSVSNT